MVALSRAISCSASPRLFTSSMLRSDSVVEPASAVVSATITFWIFLIRLRQHRAQHGRAAGTVRKKTGAMTQCTREGVDHHEDDADQRGEHHVDGRRDELLDVGAHLLQLAERLAAALVLEHRVGQLERVADAVGVEVARPAAG